MTSIGEFAFQECTSLTDVFCYVETVPNTENNAFEDTNITSATLHVTDGSIEAYRVSTPWNSFGNIIPIGEDDVVSIGSTGYATYCSKYALDFSEVSGLKAYIASGFEPSTGTLVLTRALKVPAGEGLYLVGDAGTYVVPISETDMVYSNLLKGVTTATTISPTDGSYTNFILSNGSHGVGFYTLSAAGELSAGKAYLQLPTASVSSVKAINLAFGDDEETAVQSIKKDTNVQGIFNIQGQRVDAPTRGLYIINGKKVFIK